MKEVIENIVIQQLEALGFELAEMKLKGTHGRPVLEVRIDRRDLEAVSVEDCARVSRAVEGSIDASGALGDRYVLEVSSAGVERPLRRAAEWRRFIGRRASVASNVLGGRAEVEILSVEGGDGAEVVVVRDASGLERRIPLSDVREARLVFHWQR